MRVGYRATLFIDPADEDGVKDSSEYLFTDESLDAGLDRIKEILRDWIRKGGSPDESFRHLNIHVFGPFTEETCIVDRRTPEQRLADAACAEERFSELSRAARSRFGAGDYEGARAYVQELQEVLPNYEDHPYYEDAAASIHIVLGRLALVEGDVERAKKHLVEAGSIGGSPVRSSFGPNMSLARDLLLAGEDQAVLDYFSECRRFWELGSDKLDEWTAYVKTGLIPDFGANLNY